MLLVTDSSLGYGKGMSTFLHSVGGDDKLFFVILQSAFEYEI